MKPIFFILILSGCQYLVKHEGKQHDADLTQIEQVRAMYEEIYSEVENELDQETGWPALNDCDGLLWSGLACNIGMPVKIELAEYSPGEIHRRPFDA